MRVRQARPADLDEVLRIEHRSMPDPWSAIAVAAELRVANSAGWVATAEGRVQGYAFFRTCRPECELLRLAVEPESRGAGIGRALLNDLVALGEKNGWARLYWHTDQNNHRARKLYDSFVEVDDHVRYRMDLRKRRAAT